MRRKGSARPAGSLIEGELILPDLLHIGADSGDRLRRHRHERVAVARAADHRRRELFRRRGIAAGLLVDELPELPHILIELAHHEIRAIPPEILFSGALRRGQQIGARGIGIEQRAIGDLSVFVRIPEQELAERDDVRVFELGSASAGAAAPSRSAAG